MKNNKKEGILVINFKKELGDYYFDRLKQQQYEYGFDTLEDWCVHLIERGMEGYPIGDEPTSLIVFRDSKK